jgi:hypothetical protein
VVSLYKKPTAEIANLEEEKKQVAYNLIVEITEGKKC